MTINVSRWSRCIRRAAALAILVAATPWRAPAQQPLNVLIVINRHDSEFTEFRDQQTATFSAIVQSPVAHDEGTTSVFHYLWDFGDGEGSTLPDPDHRYRIGDEDAPFISAVRVEQEIVTPGGSSIVGVGEKTNGFLIRTHRTAPTARHRFETFDLHVYPEPGEGTIEAAIAGVPATPFTRLAVHLAPGVYTPAGNGASLIVSRNYTYLIGNTNLRTPGGETIAYDATPGFDLVDPDAEFESSKIEAQVHLNGLNVGVFDAIIAPPTPGMASVRITGGFPSGNHIQGCRLFGGIDLGAGYGNSFIQDNRIEIGRGGTGILLRQNSTGGSVVVRDTSIFVNDAMPAAGGSTVGVLAYKATEIYGGNWGDMDIIQILHQSVTPAVGLTLFPLRSIDAGSRITPEAIGEALVITDAPEPPQPTAVSPASTPRLTAEDGILTDAYGRIHVSKSGPNAEPKTWDITSFDTEPPPKNAVEAPWEKFQ
jgi:hypothetical protein